MGENRGRHRAQNQRQRARTASAASRRRARLVLITSGVTATAVTFGIAGPALAVNPTQLRSGCEWNTAADQARNIQTCTFFSNSLQRDVTVEVRASDQAAGGTEQGIYFLDGLGATDDHSTWANPDVGELDAYSKAVNLVLPAGGAGEWMTNWQSSPVQNGTTVPAPQWDTFLSSELPTYLNENFSVQQRNNAVVGVSMSAGPAIILALNHPDVFSVVRAFSGFYQTDNVAGQQLISYIQNDRAGISNGGTAMWGDPSQPGNVWSANDVSKRLGEIKANGQTVIISVGNGVPVLKTVLALAGQGGLLAIPQIAATIATGTVIEMSSLLSTGLLNAQAFFTGAPVRFEYNLGSHDFYSWASTATSDAAAIEKALADAQAKSQTATTIAKTTPTSTAQLNAAVVKQVSAAATGTPVAASSVSPTSSPASLPSVTAASPVFPQTPTTSVTVPASSVTTPITPPVQTPVAGSTAAPTTTTAPTTTAPSQTSTSVTPSSATTAKTATPVG